MLCCGWFWCGSVFYIVCFCPCCVCVAVLFCVVVVCCCVLLCVVVCGVVCVLCVCCVVLCCVVLCCGAKSGASHDNLRTPNVHIRGSQRFKHHQNSTRRHTMRDKKNEIEGGRGKKARNFGPTHPSGTHPSGFRPHYLGPHFFLGLAPHPLGPHHDTHQIGPNWIGQNWSNQDQNGIGQSRSLPSRNLLTSAETRGSITCVPKWCTEERTVEDPPSSRQFRNRCFGCNFEQPVEASQFPVMYSVSTNLERH